MKTNSPTHDAISQRARQIWEAEGNPHGRDTAIWLNAEQQLSARLTTETAAESVVEFSLPSSTSEADAVRAALQTPESRGTKPPTAPPHATPAPSPAATAAQAQQQKKAARSPQLPTSHAAPTPAPPESGKPIWDKPHSS